MNRQSNTYTIIYSVVLVAIVGVVLSVVYQALRPRQIENINNDTRRQILAAALITPQPGEDIAAIYKEHITSEYLVDTLGNRVNGEVNIAALQQQVNEGKLPVFECNTDNGLKYILPVYGAGLWGPIWGYIAFDNNGDTIYGAFFGHQGETPGLGAEIEKPAFQQQFDKKNIFAADGTFQSVKVVKNGQEPKDGSAYVHAISGGTITSQGVQKMLYNSLRPYTAFLTGLNKANK